jgi:dTDP-4-dehydrorhamnose 3,5-epimerase
MIDGVETRDLQVNADERGHLVETFREDWKLYDPEPAMSYYSLSHPGVIRAWHRHHRGQVDRSARSQGRRGRRRRPRGLSRTTSSPRAASQLPS